MPERRKLESNEEDFFSIHRRIVSTLRNHSYTQQFSGRKHMQNSSRTGRLVTLIVFLAFLGGGVWWGSIYVRSWLFGVFHGEQVFYFLFALILVTIFLIKSIEYIGSFFEKPKIIRSRITRKLVKIEKTTDEDTGKESRSIVGHIIKLRMETGRINDEFEFELKEEVFNWLNVGDAVKITYYQSIEGVDSVAQVTKLTARVSPEAIRRRPGAHRAQR